MDNQNQPFDIQQFRGEFLDFMMMTTGNTYVVNRQYRLAHIMKAILYLRGSQYLVPTLREGQPVNYRPVTMNDADPVDSDTILSTSNYNYVRSLARKFESVLATKAPNVQAEPLVEASDYQSALAEKVTRICQALRKFWPVEQLQKQACYIAWNCGTIFTKVTWEEDGDNFGFRLESTGQTTQDGAELMVNKANGAPKLEFKSEIDVSLPLMQKDIAESPWMVNEEDVFVAELIGRYPVLRDNLTPSIPGAPSNMLTPGSQARQFIAALDGGNRYGYETETKVYVSPRAYPIFRSNVMVDGQAMRMGDFFASYYPKGLRYTFVRTQLVDVAPAKCSDIFGCGVPDISDRVLCDPLVKDFLPIQDAVNTQMIIWQEMLEQGLPSTLIDAEKIDIEALADKAGAFAGKQIPVKTNAPGELASAMYNMPQSSIDPRNLGLVQWMVEIGKEFLGILPSIYGGETGSQTAYEAERRLNQALQQLSLAWLGMRQAWKSAYINALRLMSQQNTEALAEFGIMPDDMMALRSCFAPGGRLINVSIQVEETIPVMRGQLTQMIKEILGLGPVGAQILGVDDPDNAGRIKGAIGLADWNEPVSSQRKWVRDQIVELLNEQPMMDFDPQTGQQVPVQSSKSVDAVYADPQVAFSVLRAWLIGDGAKVQRENPMGYQNVYLWATQWLQAMMPPPEPEPGQAPPQEPPVQ